jgi:hypothetical protein
VSLAEKLEPAAPEDDLPSDLLPAEKLALEWSKYIRQALARLDRDDTSDQDRAEYERQLLAAPAIGWVILFAESYSVFPVWPTVDNRCSCPAGAACRSVGRHPMVRGLREAVKVGSKDTFNRAALTQVMDWSRQAPLAGVGLMIEDGYVVVRGPNRHAPFSGGLTFTNLVTEETDMVCALDSNHILPEDLGAGLRVRQPGDFVIAYAGARENSELGVRERVVEVDNFRSRPLRAPDWLMEHAEPAPKAACDRELRLDVDPPEVRWLCQSLGIAPGRPTVIGGFAGGGKSPFAQALAICVALGRPFLGMQVRQERVAWAAFEAAQAAHFNLRRIARGIGVKPEDVPLDAWSFRGKLNDKGTLADIRRRILAEGHGLLVIDSYTSALRDVDHNSSGFGDALRQLEKLSDDTGCTIAVLMHTTKHAEKSGSREIAGHFSAVASAQAVISLTRPDPEKLTAFRVSCARALFAPFKPFEIEFADAHESAVSRETPSWGLTIRRSGENPCEEYVAGMIGSMPGLGRPEILVRTSEAGYGRNETDAALKKLREAGRVEVKKSMDGRANEYVLLEGGNVA